MKYLVTPVFVIFALASCATIEEKAVDLKVDIDTVFFENSEGIKLFFAKEAAEAGVSKIRAMDASEKPTITHPLQTSCGVAFNQRRLILIDTSRKKCINLHNLSHEISHIGAKCGRHVDRFYKYNIAMAERFEATFPDFYTRDGWFHPMSEVRTRSRSYRSSGSSCE